MYDENSNTTISALGTSTSSSGIMNQILNVNVKDSRWLQLEVCREFQRGQCSRSDEECKFAHPPPHVDVQNGRVTACYDSIKVCFLVSSSSSFISKFMISRFFSYRFLTKNLLLFFYSISSWYFLIISLSFLTKPLISAEFIVSNLNTVLFNHKA